MTSGLLLVSTFVLQVVSVAPAAVKPAVAGLASARTTGPVKWKIDPTHSELNFRIRHFVSRVTGTFQRWEGTVVTDPTNWAGSSVDVTIQTSTIDTNNERRDNDLKSSNFFSVDTFPTITFKSTRVDAKGTTAKIYGDLTIRNVTKPVVLDAEFLGAMKDNRGMQRLGFRATTRINRLDYGVVWNRLVEGGGSMLGDDVDIEITVAAVEQPATPPPAP